MNIQTETFGILPDGTEVFRIRLTNKNGLEARVLNYGGTIQSILTPDRTGVFSDIVLGYDSLEEYIADDCYFGAMVGRVANRIAGASFELNGKMFSLNANEGSNMLHGGDGFHKKNWNFDLQEDALVLQLLSPDGEDGFPGNLEIQVKIMLTDDNALRMEYEAVSDKDTLCSLTNHSYFNLTGVLEKSARQRDSEKDAEDVKKDQTTIACGLLSVGKHQLQLAANAYTPVDKNLIPTGEILPVQGSMYDFQSARPVGEEALDGNLVLSKAFRKWDARVYEPASGRFLSVKTSLPGLQLYNGGGIKLKKGKSGILYGPCSGLALEPQFYPDAIHHPEFPKPILKAGEKYHHFIEYKFGVV